MGSSRTDLKLKDVSRTIISSHGLGLKLICLDVVGSLLSF